MQYAAVFLPLLGGAIAGLFGRLIGDRAAQIVTCAGLGLAAIGEMSVGIILRFIGGLAKQMCGFIVLTLGVAD